MIELRSTAHVDVLAPELAIEEIGETVVAVRGGVPIRARDIAQIREGGAPKRGDGSFDTAPAVVLGVQKQPGVNTLELMERLDAELDAIEAALPQGMELHRASKPPRVQATLRPS